MQAAFDRALHDGASVSERALRTPGSFPYIVLFAPAWLYRSHPETGSDFVRQRELLDRLGIPNRMIETDETGTVEENAAMIAAALREAGPDGAPIMLVSTSKSGAEAALALTRLLAPHETRRVAAWVNIGGALGGTLHADAALRPPSLWLTHVILWITRWNLAGVRSMATEPSRERLQGTRLPEWITVVNLVGVPLSGTIAGRAWWGYIALREHGPNDGVVLLTDAVWPRGANLVALGSDHLFASLQDDAHGLALLRAVAHAVELHGAALRAAPLPAPR